MALDDYGSILQSGFNLVPDVQKQILQRAQAQELGAEARQADAQTQALQQKQVRAQQFQQAFQASDGSPQAVSRLMQQFPEFADQLKAGYDLQDNANKQADLTTSGEIYSAANSGNWKLAQTLAHARADAERAAGRSNPQYEAAIGMMDKAAEGDPAAQKTVLNVLGTHLAAVTGPEHFGTVYGALKGGYTLEAGATRYDDNGNVVAQSPFIKGADGTIYERDGHGGPANTASTPTSAPAGTDTGFDKAVEFVLKHEGGYNPHDMNGSPVNFGINQGANPGVDVKSLTPDEAKQIYKAKYWDQSGAANLPAQMQTPYFDTYVINPKRAQQFLTASGGDPNKFLDMRDNWLKSLSSKGGAAYQKAWSQRTADLRAGLTDDSGTQTASAAPSGYHVLVPGNNSPDQYHVLTPAEIKQRGLDPDQQYQLNTNTGQVTGLGKRDAADNDVLGQYHIQPGETGPSVLQKLPANLASQVKALAEGRLPMPSSFALAKPYWQTMLQLTAQYDPSFDAANAPARKAAITAFTGNGKAAQTIGSINRVANHLELLSNESKRLAGPELGNSVLNSLAATAGQAFEPQDAKAYDTEVQFIAGELEKIARNSPGTASGVEQIIKNLSRKQSASTRESAIKAAVGIISGAVDPLKDQYNSAFTNGATRPNIPWVSPKAQQIYRNIGGVDLSLTGANADTNASGDNSAGWITLPSGLKIRKIH